MTEPVPQKSSSSRRAEMHVKVIQWSVRLQLLPTRVTFRRMTRFWGVCNPDNSITFSTALLEQPEAFRELVIVHELIHLLIRDHGPNFQRLLKACLPDCEETARLAPENPMARYQVHGVRDGSGTYRVARSAVLLAA